MHLKSAFVTATILVVGMMLMEQAYILDIALTGPGEPGTVYAEYVLESLGLR